MTTKRHNYYIILMFIVATALISLALPRQDKVISYSYELNKPWLNDVLTAPFDIPIEYDDEQRERITDSVNANFIRIYRLDTDVEQQQLALLNREMTKNHVSGSVRQRLLNDVANAYSRGIVDNATSDAIANGTMTQVRILNEQSVASLMSTVGMQSVRQVYTHLDSTFKTTDGNIVESLKISKYLVPNITLDKAENDKLLNDALASALVPSGIVQQGEAIVYRGNIITPQKFAIIKTLETMLNKKAQETNLDENMMLVGKILVITIIMLMYCYFMILMRYRVYSNMRSMVFMISFMTLFIIMVFLIEAFKSNYLNLIPFAIVPIILMTFFDSRISFFTHIVVIIICSLAAREQAEFIIMQFLAGCLAISSMQELTRRSQLVQCALLIFVAYSATHIATFLSRGGELADIDWHTFLYYGINCVVLSFAYVAIFVIEKLFGFTSLVTLVELSDINTPLLRQLSERCPGTFQHVLQVANIAAEASIKVGASQQLVRAGALYHDIGKIENPAFFTENQTGVNPHDALEPEQSAHIVLQHVIDGLRMADKHRLPQVIKDLIAQHHGTSMARYFYTQACNNNGGNPVDPAPYTYIGPKPQTKEAAILMMADACEAAARSLTDHSEQAITTLVEKIIDGQIASGQLKEAPISFMQVETVKKVFVERLKIFYHTRISYPDDIKPAKQD